MSESLPLNDFGTSIVSKNCQQLSVNMVIQQYRQQWQKQLVGATVEVMDTPVQFTQSKMSHGGVRLWFACPQCGRRCGTLFQHPLSTEIGCRVCIDVKYGKSRYKNMVEADMGL